MKFNLEANVGSYLIQSYQAGQISVSLPIEPGTQQATVAHETLRQSVVIMPQQLMRDWPPQHFDELSAAHFDVLATLQPELILFGSGARLRFPAQALLAGLTNQGIGVEVMDTGAACRTYNILMTEGRSVAAALLMI